MILFRAKAVLCLLAAASGLTGCTPQDGARELELRNQRDAAVRRAGQLTEQVETLSTELRHKDRQIATLRGLEGVDVEKLYTTRRIELGRFTGGIDTDGKPGHDAIRVFLTPIDREESPLKRAGSVTVQLYDLAADEDATLLAEFDYPPDKAGKHFASGLMVYHYSFDCPLPGDRPLDNDKLTVRVTFTELLTGRTVDAQKVVTLQLPPTKTSP
jgi:hypothetical protein